VETSNQISTNKLPTKTLGELSLSLKRGISSYGIKGDDLTVRLVNVRDLQDGIIVTKTVEQVTVKNTMAVHTSRLSPGDLLVIAKGQNFRASVAKETHRDFTFSTNLIGLTLSAEVVPEYVATYLNCPFGQKEILARAAGATIQGLTAKSLLEIPIPIPTLEVQKKLAGFSDYYRQYVELMNKEVALRTTIRDALMQKVLE
jgi:type I restriction enzyme M protein